MNTDLADRLATVDAQIAAAARAAGRDPSELTRIVVTKFHPASLVAELYALGVRDVGENRQQELTAKVDVLRQAREPDAAWNDLRWHFIGQAQTNKARALHGVAATVPLTVHSVDRLRLVDALEATAGEGDPVLDVLLQVNLTDDLGRGGVAPAEVEAVANRVQASTALRLRGVMGVAPLDEPPASAFSRLRACADLVRRIDPDATWISAGMTADFAEAIAAGATHLRIGTAITGPRPVGR